MAHNLCKVARDEYVLQSQAAGTTDAEANKNTDVLALTLHPKFESACQAANTLIINKLEEFLAHEEARNVKDQARISLLKGDASETGPVVLAQEATAQVVLAEGEERTEGIWKLVLSAFLLGAFGTAWILLSRAELQLVLK